MKKIFLVPNVTKDKDLTVTLKVVKKLTELGAVIYLPDSIGVSIPGVTCVQDAPHDSELIVVIGGDGSFIDAAGYAIKNNIPILGINLGKVGYLSEVEPYDLSILSKLFKGEYRINERMLLAATVISSDKEIKSDRLAVNDVVLTHSSYLGISEFVLYSNEGGIKYRADGIVVSTPAGSTAYSLSSGGPIVSHDAPAVIVTPISSHSFFNRSIVFGEKEIINIKNTSSENMILSIDGRFFATLHALDKCRISVSEKTLKVLTFKNNNMFSNLFSKMKTVEDII